MTEPPESFCAPELRFLAGGGEMGALLRAKDWSGTPLGPPARWPTACKTAVSLCLGSPTPAVVWFGRRPEDLIQLYNDAYRPVLGLSKHPLALGGRPQDVWPEIWDIINPIFEAVLSRGESVRRENEFMVLERNGYPERTWFTHAHSPILDDEDGQVIGVFTVVIETTVQVQSARRLAFRADLAESLRTEDDAEAVIAMAVRRLGEHLGVSRCGLAEFDASGDRLEVRSEWTDGQMPSLPSGLRLSDFGSGVAAGLHDGIVIRLEDVRADPRTAGPVAEAYAEIGATRAGLAAPVHREGRLAAAVYAHQATVRRWSEGEAAIVREVAELTWAAVERSRAQKALRESEDRYRHAVELTPQAAWTANSGGVIDQMSPRWRQWTGQDGLGQSWLDVVHPDDRQRALDAVLSRIGQGGHFDLTMRLRFASGEYRWVRSRGYPRLDEAGTTIKWYGATEDIHQAVMDAEALRESETRFRLFAEAAREGVMIHDFERILDCTPAYARMFGYDKPEDVIGRSPFEMADADALDTLRPIPRVARDQSIETVGRRRDGSVFPHDFIAHDITWRGQPARIAIVRDLTEVKQTEAELRASSDKFRTLATAMPALVFVADESDGNIDVNQRYCDYTGLPREALMGWGWINSIAPADRALAADIWNETSRRGDVYAAEYRVVRADGAERWHLMRASPVPSASGRRLWLGAAVEIQEIVEARELLSRSRDELAQEVAARTAERDQMWRLSRDLMCVARLDGALLSVNPAWERLLGWPPEQIIGRTTDWIQHPADRVDTLDVRRRLEGAEPGTAFENRLRRTDGSWRWISWVSQRDGELIYSVGRDVTGEREAAEALRSAEAARREVDAQYRAYFEGSSDVLFVVDVLPDGTFRYLISNPAAGSVGFANEEIAGRTPDDLFGPEMAAEISANYQRCVDRGEPLHYAERLHLGGIWRDFETSLAPLRNPEGRIHRIMGIGREMTDRNRLEQQLRQSQKMQAVGQLAGGIAHDFNNLLSAVVGSLDLVRTRAELEPRTRRFVDNAFAAAERGAKLTAQLLAFSRAQRIELKSVAVDPLIEGMQDMLARTLGPQVRLRLALEDGGARVLSDPTQLEMAVLNLAINARDAMPDGGELTISTRLAEMTEDSELDTGKYVELAVTDTGCGMTQEVVARAFDPFFTTKGVGHGTGLGLSQVYGFTRQSNGSARIESRVGEGTRVTLLLRLTEQTTEVVTPGASSTAPGEARAAWVLVIDDDPEVRRFLADTLEILGYAVSAAAGGQEGLDVLDAAEGSPDVVLLDFAMPGMNGAEVAARIRERRPEMPIVFVSGYADTAAIETVAGPEARVLRKPFRVDHLQAAVFEVTAARAPRPM